MSFAKNIHILISSSEKLFATLCQLGLLYIPGMAFHVYCLVVCDLFGLPLPIPSTSNNLVVFQGNFNILSILLGNGGPLLTIPSTSIFPFLRQGTFNKAKIMLDIANLPLTIPSTKNHHFHVYSTKILLVNAGLSFTVPSIRNRFSYSKASTGQSSVGCCRPPSDYSIQQESFQSPP